MNKKYFLFILTIFFLLVIFILRFWPYADIFFKEEKTTLFLEEKAEEKPEIKLYFVGDIMLDRGVLYYIQKNNDWKWPFLNIAQDLQEADLLFGNLESMISDKGYDLGGKYSFRAPPQTMQGLTYAGFDILSVANNHSFDYTREAFADTLKRLKKENILYVGGGFNYEEAHTVKIKEIKDTKIGFLAYTNVGFSAWQATQNEPGIAWVDESSLDVLKNDIKEAKKSVDILIVSFHFGQEYEKEPDENQKLLAESALKAGADIIVGHHPHVVQSLEKNEQGIIAYSLGNFVFDQYFSEETMSGAILQVLVKDKEIIKAELMKTKINSQYQVSKEKATF